MWWSAGGIGDLDRLFQRGRGSLEKAAHPFALSRLALSRRTRLLGGLPHGGGRCFRRRLTLFQLYIAIFESRGDVAIPPRLDTQVGAQHTRSDISPHDLKNLVVVPEGIVVGDYALVHFREDRCQFMLLPQ